MNILFTRMLTPLFGNSRIVVIGHDNAGQTTILLLIRVRLVTAKDKFHAIFEEEELKRALAGVYKQADLVTSSSLIEAKVRCAL